MSGNPTPTPASLLAALPPPLLHLLHRAAALAQREGMTLWVVGGVVRDLLLGQPIERDLDLTVEGDALALAHALAHDQGGRIVARHEAFGTASIALDAAALPAPLLIDLARTRTEHYPHPAALPMVQPATIADDLQRRDFSINALALRVPTSGTTTVLLDRFDGQRDLQAGVLRVLHAASFLDDPTRILRGVRLAARLRYTFEPHTRARLADALARDLLEAITPERIRTELCLALEEPQPHQVLRLSDALAITPHLVPALHWSEALAARCQRAALVQCPASEHPLLMAGLLTYDLGTSEREAVIARYRLPRDATRLLREVEKLRAVRQHLAAEALPNSELDRLLRPFSTPALRVLSVAEAGNIAQHIAHYLANLRDVAPLLDGHALQQMGVPPGPQLGALLQRLRAARLDGMVITRADEEAWVRRMVQHEAGEP
jgi:tRNA nucleotidyltransferase (CCA-adding enzyme)